MLEVEIMRDTWYGEANTGEVVTFADIEKESVQSAHIVTMHKNVLDAMRNDSCTLDIYLESTANLSRWVQNLWGYEPDQRKMLIFGCFSIFNLHDGWCMKYRIVSILHIHAKSNLMKKVKLTGIRAIPKSSLLSYIRNVKRHTAEGGRKTMADLSCHDYEFTIDLNDLNIEKDDLEKISEAWAEGYNIYRKSEVFSKCYVKLVICATRINPNYTDAIVINDWKKIEPILINQEIPDDWISDVIEHIKKSSITEEKADEKRNDK